MHACGIQLPPRQKLARGVLSVAVAAAAAAPFASVVGGPRGEEPGPAVLRNRRAGGQVRSKEVESRHDERVRAKIGPAGAPRLVEAIALAQ